MSVTAETKTKNTRSESLTNIMRERIERMIVSGEVEAGGRINENALAAEFHISRGPVREAIRSLEHTGLVEIVRNRGVFVRKVSLEEALHIYDLRSGLARVAGRLLATRITTEQIDAVEALYRQMEEARAAEDQVAYNEGNRLFHTRLLEYAGNPRLAAYHQTTEKELQLFVRRGILGPARLRISSREHRKILDCIIQGDPAEAAEAFETHIINGKQRMLDSLA